ncbi:hypothetical protein [Desulfonatronum sp. SC1]|uniref:hypothetical protein n=1 Tax=Desulfonatronum sp. SC1 TaxID=2109626 RepID=UPI000D318A6D|nr:hypothetical protein [Desulfonatronum sp. SC1]PTN37864.1 hypothetical protein C6366_04880 [Desulfonatronum sp. SC1]
MWIFFLILGAALVLVLCETWLGGDAAFHGQEMEPGVKPASAGLSAWEAVVKVLPIFLGGVGLPLTLAHPSSGILCLALALGLFFLGRTFSN